MAISRSRGARRAQRAARSTETLFGSLARAKMLRFFAVQPEGRWASQEELSRRLKLKPSVVRREISLLASLGLIKARRVGIAKPPRRRSRRAGRRNQKKKVRRRLTQEVFFLNESFPALTELRLAALRSLPTLASPFLHAMREAGRIRLLLLSGALTGDPSLPTDVLIIGESIRLRALHRALAGLEQETGLDLRYTLLSGDEFKERRALHDRFLRDVLESPQQRLIDTLLKDTVWQVKPVPEPRRLPLR